MKVFISWSGDKSKAFAELLREWLPMFLDNVTPWVSSMDIGLGNRWGKEIGDNLSVIDIGILCLTPESVVAPWVLFEAGALSKSVDAARVIPLLVDLDKRGLIGSPLGQFQATRVNEKGMLELAKTLAEISDDKKALGKIRDSWGFLWSGFQSRMKDVSAISVKSTNSIASSTEIQEEELFESDGILYYEKKTPKGGPIYVPHCPICHSLMTRTEDFVRCKKCGHHVIAPVVPSNRLKPTPPHVFHRGW